MKSKSVESIWFWQLNYQNTFSMPTTERVVSYIENIFWSDNGITVLNTRYSYHITRQKEGGKEDCIDYLTHFTIVILC